MKNPIEAYKDIRSQIFEALEPDAINAMSSEQLAKQLKQAVELLIDKDQLSVSAVTQISDCGYLYTLLSGSS